MHSDYAPSSPLSLAISSILALIPLNAEEHSGSWEQRSKRRNQAHDFASSCLNSIDFDTELIESIISPADALQKDWAENTRTQFHPNVPLKLESVLAMLLLSTYEYAQRGNMAKMRSRAGQALVMALDMGLCDREDKSELYVEARRRAWWMTVNSLEISASTNHSRK